MCIVRITEDINVMNTLSVDYRTSYSGFTLGLLGGPGTSKSTIVSAPTKEEQKYYLSMRIGKKAGLSTLKNALVMYCDDPQMAKYILVLARPLISPLCFQNQKSLFYKVLAERIFEYEDEENDELLIVALVEEFEDKVVEFRNTVKAFKLLGEAESQYFRLLSRAITCITKEDLYQIKMSAIAGVDNRPTNKKKLIKEAKQGIADALDSYIEGREEDSPFIQAISAAIEYANNGIRDIFNAQFFKIPEVEICHKDNFTHYRLIDVSGGVHHNEKEFLDKLFFNNNAENTISLEVACAKLEIRLPMSDSMKERLNEITGIGALSNGKCTSFALLDMPGLLHYEKNNDELKSALISKLADRNLDGVLYSIPAHEPPLSSDVNRMMKQILKDFESDLPLYLLTGHSDQYFEDKVKDLKQDKDEKQPYSSAYSSLLKLDFDRREELKAVVKDKSHRIKVLGSSPIALKESLVDYPQFARKTNVNTVLSDSIEKFLEYDKFYSNRIPYYSNEEGGAVILELNENRVDEIMSEHLKGSRFLNRTKPLLYNSFTRNALGPHHFLHPQTRIGFGYSIRGCYDFHSKLNEPYWKTNYKRIDFEYVGALSEFFNKELQEELVRKCVETPEGEIDRSYEQDFVDKVRWKISLRTFIKHLMYEQLYTDLLLDSNYYGDTSFYKKYVENAIMLLTDSNNSTGYTKAAIHALSAAVKDVQDWGLRAR